MFVSSILLHFVLLFWENYAILQIKDSLKKKNLAFVENLKHDLRRNNDDYTDIIRQSNDTQVVGITHKIIAMRRNNKNIDVRDKLIDKISRRVNDALKSKESNDISANNPQRRLAITVDQPAVSEKKSILPFNNVPRLKPFRIKQNKIKQKNNVKTPPGPIKLFTNISGKFAGLTTSLPVQSTMPGIKVQAVDNNQKHLNKKKFEKFKKFLDKNKGLLREFINSKLTSPQMTLTTQRPKIRLSKRISESELRKAMQEAVNGLRGKSLEDLPNAELLDMAPAKGGRIHHKRLRGRLCHRHVLVPEGPKYDSAGRAYLAAHAEVRAHEYNATRAPRLLLPRCCNCCRKSVLGCE